LNFFKYAEETTGEEALICWDCFRCFSIHPTEKSFKLEIKQNPPEKEQQVLASDF